MGDLLGLLGTGAAQFIMSIIGTVFQHKAQEEATEAIDAQVAEIKGIFSNIIPYLEQTVREGNQAEMDFANFVLEWYGAKSDEAMERATSGYETLISETLGGIDKLTATTMEGYAGRTGSILSNVRNIMQEVQQRMPDVMGPLTAAGKEQQAGYEARLSEAMGYLDEAGEQARRDIHEEFGNLEAEARAEMTSRGMMSTTVWPSIQKNIQEAESAEMRRLDDDLRQQQLEWQTGLQGELLQWQERTAALEAMYRSGLSGDAITSMMWGAGIEADLSGEELAALERLGMYATGTYAGLSSEALQTQTMLDTSALNMQLALLQGQQGLLGNWRQDLMNFIYGPQMDYAGFLGGITHNYPDLASFVNPMQQMGHNALYEAPESGGYSWESAAGSGIGAGLSIGLAPFTGGASLLALPATAPGFVQSDRNIKENLTDIDHEETLNLVGALPVTRWNYVAGVTERVAEGDHIGPMAQDFKELFGLGDSDKKIDLVDAFGVSLSAIKALLEQVHDLQSRLAFLETREK